MFFTFGLKEYGRNNEVVLSRGGRKAGFHCSILLEADVVCHKSIVKQLYFSKQ